MCPVDETVWEIEPHTKAKHEILKSYLGAWFPILTNSRERRIVFVDGFAGPGIYEGGEPGSPIVALTTARDHKLRLNGEIVFWFIESRQDRFDNLADELGKIEATLPANFKILRECSKFDETINKTLDAIEGDNARLAPSFVFVDPFGYSDTPMSVMTRIMRNKKCEVLVTLMHRDIDRFMSRPEVWGHLDNLFGSPGWREATKIASHERRREFIRRFYMQQMKDLAGVRFVSSFEMRDRADQQIYCLIHGTNSMKGLEEMKKAFWRIDKSGNYRFADRTIPGQSILFGRDLTPCQDLLVSKFKGKTVPKEMVTEFIICNTPYLRKHFTEIMRDMEHADPPRIVVEVAGKRRAGTYPDKRTSITFV